MSRDKQIEEMAKILCRDYSMGECMVDGFDCLEGHCSKRERIEALYNKDGVYCKCYECGYETKRKSMNAVILDHENKRMGTPVIEKSLMGAIRQAVNDWNGRSENGKS
jgi:hypothetical protein